MAADALGSTPQTDRAAAIAAVVAIASALPDPEIPVLNLGDLGVIRWARFEGAGVVVGVTPTYTGCPATEVIEASVATAVKRIGHPTVRIERVLSPPWTTDWISADGRRKLREYGIAPPAEASTSKRALGGVALRVTCPRCSSDNTTRVSEFGSTPCKASYKCGECLEPFEYFKCL